MPRVELETTGKGSVARLYKLVYVRPTSGETARQCASGYFSPPRALRALCIAKQNNRLRHQRAYETRSGLPPSARGRVPPRRRSGARLGPEMTLDPETAN